MSPGSDSLAEHLENSLDHGGVLTLLLPRTAWEAAAAERFHLDPAERVRAGRFRHGDDRLAFLAGRRLVRQVLELRIGRGDAPLEFGPRGKPLCPLPGTPRFNLSHSRNWVGLSVCGEVEVGLDLEDLGREVSWRGLSRRYFSMAERERVDREGREAFFEIWTRKEARVKAQGSGLTVRLSELDTLREEREGRWRFHGLRPDTHSVGTLVYPGVPRPHLCLAGMDAREWTPMG